MRAELESADATSADVVRKEEREAKGIAFARGVPLTKDGRYLCGNFNGQGTKFRQMLWDKDPNPLMVCDMQGSIEAAADERFAEGYGSAQREQKDLFLKLVKDEEANAPGESKSNRRPYKARVALSLILLLASVLG
jgi:hypothetical protein